MNVHPSKKAKLIFVTENNQLLEESKNFLLKMGYGSELLVQTDKTGIPQNAMTILTKNLQVFIPFEELVDLQAEKQRLEEEKKKLEAEVQRASKMLANPGFINKAPEQKIQEEKQKLAKYQEMLQSTIERLQEL